MLTRAAASQDDKKDTSSSNQEKMEDTNPSILTLKNKIIMLTAKQQSLFQLVESMYELSTGCISDDKVKSSFLIRIKSLEKVRQEYTEVTEQLTMAILAVHPKTVVEFKQLIAFDELYCHIKAVEAELSSVATATQSIKSHLLTQTSNNFDVLKRKLPALELVSFDGSPNKWVMFYENFTALIHNNANLSDAEKVQYLIGKLSGRALSVCAGIPPIASNYNILWNALKDKYQDKRTLATMYLEQILNFKGSQTPSTNSLDAFIEHFCAAQSALKQLGIDDLSDFIFTHLAISKLDKDTVNLFEQAHREQKLPTFDSLTKFIKEQSKIHMLRSTGVPTRVANTYANQYAQNKTQQNKSYIPQYNKPRSPATQAFVTQNDGQFPKCTFCKNDSVHPLYRCEAFLKLNASARFNFVRTNNLCTNCLGFHSINSCRSYNRCTVCNRMHHTQLHIDSARFEPASAGTNAGRPVTTRSQPLVAAACDEDDAYSPSPPHSAPEPPIEDAREFDPYVQAEQDLSHTKHDAAFTSVHNANTTTVLLPSAVVYVYNDLGERLKMRVFLDSGSMCNFITKSCCDRLNINITHAPATVKGIGLSVKPVIGFAKFTIHSRFDTRCSYTINARVIDTITDKMPNAFIDTSELNHLRNLSLADEDFHSPADFDCLIGNELFPFLLGSRKITAPGSSVVGVDTSLGYVVMGRADCVPYSSPRNNNQSFHASIEPTLENLTQRFWELESVPTKKHISPDEEVCERIFKDTFARDDTGRYTVALPFKYEPTELGRSDNIAKTRLLNLEKRLNSNPELRKDYNATLQDYIDKGYLNKIENPSRGPCYYIPHHAIYRPDKATTKTRIVLDASCKTSSNKSLNDVLYTGPNLQTNIFDLLINLRLFPIALSADIEKMFFQLKLDSKQHKFQRILFRFNPDDPITTYEFSRVAFGISTSPYLAMRVVRQLADDERSRWPAAAWAAERHFFMDDYVSSVSTVTEAEQLFYELTQLFKAGGFNLIKWVTNSTELMKRIPIDQQAPNIVKFDEDNNIKIIGLQWKTHEDSFFFKVNANHSKCTKRTILSVAARLFDPLSLLGPVTALLKLLVQECWKRDLDWDDDVPACIADQWAQFQNELHVLENIKIPRHIGIFENTRNILLIGFADASEKCYGAAIYLRISQGDSDVGQVTLLCAKSKVASSNNVVTLPRLELCAALLLSNLIVAVRDSISERVKINEIIAFTDSTITLSWIRAPPFRFQTFVANRISAINENLPARHWFHIPGNENPADIISRPVMPSKLVDNDLWFHGPSWLALQLKEWPIQTNEKPIPVIELPETKSSTFAVQTVEHSDVLYDLANRMSKWNKYLHAVVYVLRFAKLLKSRNTITVQDLETAQNYIVRSVQRKHFCEIKVPALQKLNVFIDEFNLIRVGGRLNNAQSLNFTQRHPIVLPANDRIVHLLVDHAHIANAHAGPSLLLALLRENYWILSARSMIRKRLQGCNACFKLRPKNTCPLMGDLPHFRVSEVKSFVFTGVDYAGPFFVTPYRRRGVKSVKAYLCLFICLTTKALHLELVSDLTTEMFLAAFKRFISRRGPVSMILSDGGTNFVGAKRKLDELHALLMSVAHNQYLDQHLADLRIQFKRNPPLASHFGGIYESNIKSVKMHLKRSIGNHILTYEELSTVLVQIEGILNSRPLCILSSDPNELEALTPSHFLNITPLKYLPAQDVLNVPENRLNRYELLNKLVQSYWHRWRVEYLTSLQSRQKWNTPSKPIEKGQIVIVRDDNAPVLSWPIAIVEELCPGKDQIVRVAKIKTKTGSYVRPVVKLYPLPLQ